MNDIGSACFSNASTARQRKHWLAHLQLDFVNRNDRSYLVKKQHVGPLVLQKSLHPEGADICHGVIVHPPGGVAGGDQLMMTARLAANAKVLLTTPGAGKWYKANGLVASQQLRFELAENSSLEWFPQENILFDGAVVDMVAEVNLASEACFAAWDIQCFGRKAQLEQWMSGRYRQQISIYRQNRLIWQERARLEPDATVMRSVTGLGGHTVNAAFVIAAGAVPASILAACQHVMPDTSGDPISQWGVTALPEVFCARYVGHCTQAAKQYFELLWHTLRPWYLQKSAVRPRIWNT